jgi:hypothetical protein
MMAELRIDEPERSSVGLFLLETCCCLHCVRVHGGPIRRGNEQGVGDVRCLTQPSGGRVQEIDTLTP